MTEDPPMDDTVVAGYVIDDDADRIDRDAVWAFLSTSAYWGRWRGRADIERQLDTAWRLVGAYDAGGALVGFARAQSDGVALAYLADVYVLPEHRGRSIATALVRTMIDAAPEPNFRWMLHTADAHPLYRRFGFGEPDHTVMQRPGRASGAAPGPVTPHGSSAGGGPIDVGDRAAVAAFARRSALAVISTVGPAGAPEAALVGVAALDDGTLLLDAPDDSRKVANLRRRPDVAVVLGLSGEVTVQLEGPASVVTGGDRPMLGAEYNRQRPGSQALDDGIAVVAVTPRWVRVYDASTTPPRVAEARWPSGPGRLTDEAIVRVAIGDDVEPVCRFGAEHIATHYAPLIGHAAARAQVRDWWNATVLAAAISAGSVVVAESGGRIVGVGQYGRSGDDHVVYKLYVHPEVRGHGLGPRLLEAIATRLPAEADRLCIEHFAANVRAARFYEREGFTVERTEPSPSGDPRLDVVWRVRAAGGPPRPGR